MGSDKSDARRTMRVDLRSGTINVDLAQGDKRSLERCMRFQGDEISWDFQIFFQAFPETLRLYPSVQFISRAVTKTCTLTEANVTLEKDTLVWIPAHGLHLDEDVFPDPLKFDPERFNQENKERIPPCGYMPFGDGPRNCIGLRFALVEMKAMTCELLSRYIVELCDETNVNPKLRATNILLSPDESIKLKVTPRCKINN